MTSANARPPDDLLSQRDGEGFVGPPLDEDDGIHVASVTRFVPLEDPFFRVVVPWREDGTWVESAAFLADTSASDVDAPIRDAASGAAGPSDRPEPHGTDIDEPTLRLGFVSSQTFARWVRRTFAATAPELRREVKRTARGRARGLSRAGRNRPSLTGPASPSRVEADPQARRRPERTFFPARCCSSGPLAKLRSRNGRHSVTSTRGVPG